MRQRFIETATILLHSTEMVRKGFRRRKKRGNQTQYEFLIRS
jgi:hypothetical protein